MAKIKKVIKLNSKEIELTAVEHFNKSVGAEEYEDGTFGISFTTCQKQGHGSQQFPPEYTDELVKLFEGYAKNGVPKFVESADMNPVECLQDSIKEMPDGTITFKLSGTRGSKSTIIADKAQFDEFVQAFAKTAVEYRDAINELVAEEDEDESEEDSEE